MTPAPKHPSSNRLSRKVCAYLQGKNVEQSKERFIVFKVELILVVLQLTNDYRMNRKIKNIWGLVIHHKASVHEHEEKTENEKKNKKQQS